MQLNEDPSCTWLCGLCLCDILPFGHLDDTSFNNVLNAVDWKICPKLILDDDSICCDVCHAWLHVNCAGLTYKKFKKLSNDVSTPWYCKICISSIFPFGQLNNSSWNTFLKQSIKEKFKIDVSNYNIESNLNNSCPICNKHCNYSTSLPCSNCKHLVHQKCCKVTLNIFNHLDSIKEWMCSRLTYYISISKLTEH